MSDVQGVLVTHIHPDHYGLAGRIREASGAWIALHPADAALIHDRYEEPDDLLDRVGSFLRRVGAPDAEVATLQHAAMPVRGLVDAVQPDVLMEDGDKPEVAGMGSRGAVDAGPLTGPPVLLGGLADRLMLSGDHVLPRITPNISLHPQSGDDPLGDFLQSLDKLATLRRRRGAPGPRAPLRRTGRSSRRVDATPRTALRRGRRRRARRCDHGVGHRRAHGLVASVGRASKGFMRRAAVAEAMAHLRALERRGILHENVGEPSTWELRVD